MFSKFESPLEGIIIIFLTCVYYNIKYCGFSNMLPAFCDTHPSRGRICTPLLSLGRLIDCGGSDAIYWGYSFRNDHAAAMEPT